MKRFKWTLQRLLDVTIQREQAARAALFALSRKIAYLRGEIIRRQSTLRSLLEDLAVQPLGVRITRQEVVMKFSEVTETQIAELREQIQALEQERKEKTAAFLKLRASRQSLEKLRGAALDRHLRQQAVEEQKQLDEAGQVSFARRLIGANLARG